jgi:trehalose utilization protein
VAVAAFSSLDLDTETFPIYHNTHVHRIVANAIRRAKQPHTDGRILSNWHREVPIHR